MTTQTVEQKRRLVVSMTAARLLSAELTKIKHQRLRQQQPTFISTLQELYLRTYVGYPAQTINLETRTRIGKFFNSVLSAAEKRAFIKSQMRHLEKQIISDLQAISSKVSKAYEELTGNKLASESSKKLESHVVWEARRLENKSDFCKGALKILNDTSLEFISITTVLKQNISPRFNILFETDLSRSDAEKSSSEDRLQYDLTVYMDLSELIGVTDGLTPFSDLSTLELDKVLRHFQDWVPEPAMQHLRQARIEAEKIDETLLKIGRIVTPTNEDASSTSKTISTQDYTTLAAFLTPRQLQGLVTRIRPPKFDGVVTQNIRTLNVGLRQIPYEQRMQGVQGISDPTAQPAYNQT